jgi:hypothetical protein
MKYINGLDQSSSVYGRNTSSSEDELRAFTRVKRRPGLMVSRLLLLLLAVNGGAAFCLTGNKPDLNICEYSDQVYHDDVSLKQHQPPTFFGLMPSRYLQMVEAARGYHCTGSVLVAFDGHNYMQTGSSDDPGIMEMIPTISRLLGTCVAKTYDLVIFAVISSGILIGYAGFWRSYPERISRVIGVAVFLCIGIEEARMADTYVFQVAPLIAGIPWLVCFGLSQKNSALALSAASLAFFCSWCSMVRAGTLVICMTFLITMFAARYRVQKPFLPFLLIIFACVPSFILERSLITRRDNILAKAGETATTVNRHPIWHSVYIGLGFIPNSEVSEYRDSVAAEKVRSIDPTVAYTSAKYEAILREEVLSVVKRRPMLVIESLAAKAGIVILLASILLYPARRLIFAERPALWLDAAFLLTIGVSAMNGILVVPRSTYLLTFLCLTFLYSAIKLCRRHYLNRLSQT